MQFLAWGQEAHGAAAEVFVRYIRFGTWIVKGILSMSSAVVKESDEWVVAFGRTVPLGSYLRLSAEQAGPFAVAGRVAETVLLGSAQIEASEWDFEQFIQSGARLN